MRAIRKRVKLDTPGILLIHPITTISKSSLFQGSDQYPGVELRWGSVARWCPVKSLGGYHMQLNITVSKVEHVDVPIMVCAAIFRMTSRRKMISRMSSTNSSTSAPPRTMEGRRGLGWRLGWWLGWRRGRGRGRA